MKAERLLICADASVAIGTGHVMRCLAIAQAWKRGGGTADFLVPEGLGGSLADRIRDGFGLQTFSVGGSPTFPTNRDGYQRAVLDGYGFGPSEQTALSRLGIPTLFVDDYGHAERYTAKWVLNQNLHAREEMYAKRGHDTRLLLGPGYALLREEFLPWNGWRRSVPEKASRILVTMGGSDVHNASLKILQALACLGECDSEVTLVLGASNPHVAVIRQAAAKCKLRVQIVQNAMNMPALMAWADLAIAAAGGTSYELCYMGLPSVLFVAAENQRRVAESLSAAGVAVDAGTSEAFSHERFTEQLMSLLRSPEGRQAMAQKARKIVDGLGADRIRAALLGRDLRLRPVDREDCELLFSWANNPDARAASFHSAEIPWEEHSQWFARRLADPQSVIYIGENLTGEEIGEVRFQLEGEKGILSILVAPQFRRAGWGKDLIVFSIRALARARGLRRVDAYVKPDNRASIRLFESIGFRRSMHESQVNGQTALLFAWECDRGVHGN